MTKPASEEPAADAPEPKQADQLSEQQLDDVAGAGDGRRVIDCEGYAALSENVLSPAPKLKLPE
jgi:hypothetical protein